MGPSKSPPLDAGSGQPFELVSDYQPAGDQPQAIRELIAGLGEGERDQVLLGVTGSGKTYTMAQVIRELAAARPWCWRPTRRSRPSSTAR